nr:MAG TPA: hypothetical protein [Caudoviricetes sp.]
MITKLTSIARSSLAILKYIIVAVVSFLLGYGCYAILHSTTTDSSSKVESSAKDSVGTEVLHETNLVTLKEKQRNTDPDLVVDNRYIAEINGQTFEIPKETKKESKGLQTKVTSDINMTPVVKKMADLEYKRNWEVSAGLGRSHDGHFYVPIGLQRNYNYDRAIEVSVGVSKDHIENFQVLHKWKF